MEKAKYSDVPKFKYHPNPLTSGAIVDSEDTCECCGRARGFMYNGSIHTSMEVELVCPWCIADGSASEKWNAQFTDGEFTDSHGDSITMPFEVWSEVFQRTPGVATLQPVLWWVHCEQPAAFLQVDDDLVKFRCTVCGKKHSYIDPD